MHGLVAFSHCFILLSALYFLKKSSFKSTLEEERDNAGRLGALPFDKKMET